MYLLHCINLDDRKDRIENVNKQFSNQPFFKVQRFNAIHNKNGHIGCLSSHLQIIKDNYESSYTIVIEDDIELNDSCENIKNILDILIENIGEWEIFNGTPTFWNLFKDLENQPVNYVNDERFKDIVESKIPNTPFINISWGQSTTFMVYPKKNYDKIINILEKAKETFVDPIDTLFSKHFIQTTYCYGHLFNQREDHSTIENRLNNGYLDYQKQNELFLTESVKQKVIQKKMDFTIGVYSIFIGSYSRFFDKFVKSIEEHFFPQYKKKFFIITNKDLPKHENCYIYKVSDEYINFPFPTLFRFKYFKQLYLQNTNNVDYMFFLNGNALCINDIDSNDLPIYQNKYIYSLHDGYYDQNYNNIPYEKDEKSTACITYQDNVNYTYVGGRFYGATLIHFQHIMNVLYNNISKDLDNKYIAKWHDESHINHYFYNNKIYKYYFVADYNYHIPEESKDGRIKKNNDWIEKFNNKKIMYVCKNHIIPEYEVNGHLRPKKRCHNADNTITDELIAFYKKLDKL